MKNPNRDKSTSSTTVPDTTTSIPTTFDLELISSYSHEQVHIYDKLCSSISSLCEIAYCTSKGVIICVPPTCQRKSQSPQDISLSKSSLLVTRISYPYETNDQTNSISVNSTSYLCFQQIKDKYLPNLYQSYKHRSTSLSSFDRLLCFDTIQYKGYRQCLFSPIDITLNQGQSLLATITCSHEVFIYEIVSLSKRFFTSQSSYLKMDLTKLLFENDKIKSFLEDTDLEVNYRLLYFHLTSNILWNKTGTLFFQLQYSGHLIVWKFDQINLSNTELLSIIDTNISKPLSLAWNEQSQILIIIGKENQRALIKMDQLKLFSININENDYMNVEHALLIHLNNNRLLLIESKMNYCLIYSLSIDNNNNNTTSTYDCNQIDCHIFSSQIVGIEQQSSASQNSISIIIGCEDGTMHLLLISNESSIKIIEIKLMSNGHIKSCSRKPLFLRHFNLSSNDVLLSRIFYSPIVAPNVKFGFVLCTLHHWINNSNMKTFDHVIENYLSKINMPLYNSSDELAVILHGRNHNMSYSDQKNKSSNENILLLQRLCRLYSLFDNTKQLEIYEKQLLENYRQSLAKILQKLFSKITSKLSQYELLIYKICCKDEQLSSANVFTCPMCDTSLTLITNDLLSCTCSNKHTWPRCCRTFLPLNFQCSQTCSLCDRTIMSIDTNDINYVNFVKYKDKELNIFFSSICTYCM